MRRFFIPTSGFLNPYVVLSQDDCYLYDRNYGGGNLNDQGGKCQNKASNAAECQNLCTQIPNCNYFSWLGLIEPDREKECCLKEMKTENIDIVVGAVSGHRSCGKRI